MKKISILVLLLSFILFFNACSFNDKTSKTQTEEPKDTTDAYDFLIEYLDKYTGSDMTPSKCKDEMKDEGYSKKEIDKAIEKYYENNKELPIYPFKEYAYNEVQSNDQEITYQLKDAVIVGNKDVITDFHLYVYCDTYIDGNSAAFKAFGIKKDNHIDVTQFSIKLGYFYYKLVDNEWQNVDLSTSTRTIRLVDKAIQAVKDGKSIASSYNPSLTISNIMDLPAKSPLSIESYINLPVYAYVSYSYIEHGQKISKEYLIKYDYEDYMIDKTIIDAGTENETYLLPSIGGVEK